MADVVEDGCAQQFQHFISNSPWDHATVINQIGQDADRLLGGQPASCLLIDETSFAKQGETSAGVARQWSGRQGKVDNCQVSVFAVLSEGSNYAPVDTRLYLPKEWIDDPARCDKAGLPEEARQLVSKCGHALNMVQQARSRGLQFNWVGVDAGYGKDPAFLRALDDAGEVFMADVARNQRVWTEEPPLTPIATRNKPEGSTPEYKTAAPSTTVENLFKQADWQRCTLRDSTRGELRVDIAHRRVWVWDGEESTPRCWHAVARREVGSPKMIKYSLSNAPAGTPTLQLAQMQGQRYWVERAFEDGKGQCGLADDQAQGWRAWHHHVTMVMLAMLFIAEQRATHRPDIELITARDIVEMLAHMLPGKPETKEQIIQEMYQRHTKRQGAIDSRYRTQIEQEARKNQQKQASG
jgi:SRSO17 transposase